MHEITTWRAWFAIVVDLLPDCDSRWPGGEQERRRGGKAKSSTRCQIRQLVGSRASVWELALDYTGRHDVSSSSWLRHGVHIHVEHRRAIGLVDLFGSIPVGGSFADVGVLKGWTPWPLVPEAGFGHLITNTTQRDNLGASSNHISFSLGSRKAFRFLFVGASCRPSPRPLGYRCWIKDLG